MNRIRNAVGFSTVGRKVLGPRPGLAIVSFWQGIVEIALRVATVVVSVAALVSASCVVAKAVQLPEVVRISVEVISPDIVRNSELGAGLVIGVAGAGVLLEVAMIAVRFLNIGLLSLKIGTFLIVDIVLSVVIVVGLTGAGILPVYVAVRWTDLVLSDNLPELRDIRNCLAATAACSFLAAVVFAVLGVWMGLHLAFKWNKKIVKYTVRKAVHL